MTNLNTVNNMQKMMEYVKEPLYPLFDESTIRTIFNFNAVAKYDRFGNIYVIDQCRLGVELIKLTKYKLDTPAKLTESKMPYYRGYQLISANLKQISKDPKQLYDVIAVWEC